ncbi:MAG: hypothetical protein ACFCUM_10970 [Bacteroidales bacterium]
MKTNLNIILVLTLITGACSSTSLLSEGKDDLYYTPGEENSNDLIIENAEGKAPEELPAVADHEDEPLACEEYNVSFTDTIWFDDYLVVGRDTFTYEQVYPQFAFEEYGVTPFDTIWFDNFLVIGADTLEYQQVYNKGRKFSLSIYSPGEFYWSKRFNRGLLLQGVTPFDFHLQTGISPFDFQLQAGIVPFFSGGYGISWNYSAPLISPDQPWVEIINEGSRETSRPLYTYYMGLPPQVSERDQAPPAVRNDRERGVVFHISILSAILAFLAL